MVSKQLPKKKIEYTTAMIYLPRSLKAKATGFAIEEGFRSFSALVCEALEDKLGLEPVSPNRDSDIRVGVARESKKDTEVDGE